MDKFPEAFKRFEQVVKVKKIESFKQLTFAFANWSGRNWRGTFKQTKALEREARKRGIPIVGSRVVGKRKIGYFPQAIYPQYGFGFSRNYDSLQEWNKTKHTSAYQKRIINYLRNHPNATLAEARGHKAKRS